MIKTVIKTSHRDFTFSRLVEIISDALTFLDSADVGPWVYK